MNFKKTNGDRFLHDCFLKNDRFKKIVIDKYVNDR